MMLAIIIGGVLGIIAAQLFCWSVMWLSVQLFADKQEIPPEYKITGVAG